MNIFRTGTKFAELVFPWGLRYAELPAVKIGRLGVSGEYQRKGVGTILINLGKQIFTTRNRTGCRFITVDAYNDPAVMGFYENNDFDFYLDSDSGEDTRIMFFDLRTYVPIEGIQ